MLASTDKAGPSVLPLMRYRDVAAAVEWLTQAFGFERDVVVRDAEGEVFYAQLSHGHGMVMIGGVRDSELDRLMRQPDEVGGIETQSCYVVVPDADAHHERAKAAGGDIVLDLKTDPFGRKGYSCRDPEGHIWSFGTYDPWKGKHLAAPAAPAVDTPPPPPPPVAAPVRGRRFVSAAALMVAGATIGGVAALSLLAAYGSPMGEPTTDAELRRSLDTERTARRTAELGRESLRQDLAREAAQRAAAAARAKTAEQALAISQRDLEAKAAAAAAATRAGAAVSTADLERERTAKNEARAAVATLERQIAEVRAASAEAQARLAKEQAANDALEAEIKAVREKQAAKRTGQTIETATTSPPTSTVAASPPSTTASPKVVATAPPGPVAAAVPEVKAPPPVAATVPEVKAPTPAPTATPKRLIKKAIPPAAKPKPTRTAKKPAASGDASVHPTYITGYSDTQLPLTTWYGKRK